MNAATTSPVRTLPARDWLLGIGSNQAPERWVPLALATLRGGSLGRVQATAPAWSPAWGPATERPPYLNVLVLLTDSREPAWRLRRLLAGLEAASGRDRDHQDLVSLDLDLFGRRCAQRWKLLPRRTAELRKDYWQAHLEQLGLAHLAS